MPVQRSQGRLRPVPPRADELPAGVAVPEQAAKATPHRGRINSSERAKELGARGGRAKAGTTRLASQLTLGRQLADPRFKPYEHSARAFRCAHVTQLARDVGGGHCGPAPSSIVASAALQLAASRFAFEVLGDLALGSRMADASRANLLSAHELCAREATARQSQQGDGLAVAQRAFQQRLAQQAEQRQRLIDAPACADDSDDDAADQDALSGRTGAGT